MNIYVGNLPYGLAEDDLRKMFAQYGEVSSASIVKDKYSGQSKGFGFVEMAAQSQAEEAIKALDGRSVAGRTLKVNQARAKTPRPPRDARS